MTTLRELAERATKGPWVASGITKMIGDSRFMFVIAEPLGEICRIPQPDRPAKGFAPTICDQHFIAACDPQTIIALLDRVEKLEGALREANSSLTWAMDEIDVLSNKISGFAYPQGMQHANRHAQFDAYCAAVGARAVSREALSSLEPSHD